MIKVKITNDVSLITWYDMMSSNISHLWYPFPKPIIFIYLKKKKEKLTQIEGQQTEYNIQNCQGHDN